MLHLAQVRKQEPTGETQLQLLARQEFGTAWAIIAESEVIPAAEAATWSDGVLVLADLSPTHQVLSVQPATDWVLDLVTNYLTSDITPAFLQQEKERVEQGLQSLTLEKQELARKTLELEARREEIQGLEARLQREQQELARKTEELEALEAKLKGELPQSNGA
jgi:hypothetical protein